MPCAGARPPGRPNRGERSRRPPVRRREDAGLAEAVVSEIRAEGGEAVANTASVADIGGAASMTEQAMREWGRLDAVVANAAIVRDKPFDEMTMADFDDIIDVNLRGTMRVVQPAYKAMQAGGGGRIVTITSSSGMLGAHCQANYAASKAAVVGFTRAGRARGRRPRHQGERGGTRGARHAHAPGHGRVRWVERGGER